MATGDGTVVFDVTGIFFPTCLVEASYSEKFFSGTGGIMKYIIFQSVMDMIGVTGKSDTTAGHAGNTIDVANACVEIRAMLQKRFKQKCIEALTSRKKKSAKDLCYRLLEYKALFDPRTKSCSLDLEAKRKQERKGEYDKLYKRRSCGLRDSTWWHMARYNKMCSEENSVCSREEENVSSRDHFFRTKATGRAFKKFQ